MACKQGMKAMQRMRITTCTSAMFLFFCIFSWWSAVSFATPAYQPVFSAPFVIPGQNQWYNQTPPHLDVSTASELDSQIGLGIIGISLMGATLITQKLVGTPAALFLTTLSGTGIGTAYGIWRLMIDNDIESVLTRRFASAYNGPLPRTPEFMELLKNWRQATGFFDWLLQRRTVLENCMFIKLAIGQSSNGYAIAEQFSCIVAPGSFTFIPKTRNHQSMLKSLGEWFYAHTTYLGEQHHKSKTLHLLLELLHLFGTHGQLYKVIRFITVNSSFETKISEVSHEKTTEHIVVHNAHERIDIEAKKPEHTITFYPPISISCFEKNMVNDYLRAHGLCPVEPLSITRR